MSTDIIKTPSNYSFPTPADFTNYKEMAQIGVKSGLLPSSINTPEKALIIMLKGREMGIPPMQAFSHIYVINGKPSCSAELMLALVYKNIPGAIINITEKPDACEVEAKRPHGKLVQFSFSIDDAMKAQLLEKEPWKKYRKAMLRARVISLTCRALFPDALMGVSYTPEELGAEIEMDDEGNEKVLEKEVENETQDAPPSQTIPPMQEMINKIPPIGQTKAPLSPIPEPKLDIAPEPCILCKTPLIWSTKKGKYYCKNFLDKKGQHTNIGPDQINDYNIFFREEQMKQAQSDSYEADVPF